MKCRILLIGLLMSVLVFSTAGLAYAEGSALSGVEGPQPPLGRGDGRVARVEGEVTAIDGDVLTIETRHRGALAVHTDADTRFRALGDPDYSLADIEVGDTIAAQGRLIDEGRLLARVVALVPTDMADRASGKVTAIDGGTITVEDKDGNFVAIIATDEAKVRLKGKPGATIDDLEVGMLLAAAGQIDADGALGARLILASEPRGPKGGPVEAGKVAETNGGSFTIDFPNGVTLSVTTDASTIVITRGEGGPALGSLSDVTEGAVVVVMGVPSSGGSSLAARVVLLGRGPEAQPAAPPER